ncbi:arginase family protein [Natrinema salaciae]|uniref:Acetoin utilization deacetylase AcuC n=1 Tax=Natrinema salaciae TaxID=1186196 RepID=A0A1H9RAA7_9EURY|nr:class II histone deacetylase [Natrinema salaciae]SER69588.1 Acetoin utilization deacetylase AcuC [Natrinema salaciae]
MTELCVYYDDAALAHVPPAGDFEMPWTGRLAVREPHPDRRERIENVRSILRSELGDRTTWADIEPATETELTRVHAASYVEAVRSWADDGGGRLTAETGGNAETYRAAATAAGGAIAAAEHAADPGTSALPYALVRPSGHHAQSSQSDGFCFFNNVAVAAAHLLETGRADRVAVLDWDVHHANGTQEIFDDRDDVLLVSLHNDHWPWDEVSHPQSCDLTEQGTGDGEGYTVNVPLPAGTGDDGYRYAMDELVGPVLGAFDPDVLLVSAGQDPGTMDPLGRNTVTKAGFESLGERARALASEHADDSLALVQEGGYQITHLAYATLGVLEGALGLESEIDDPFAWMAGNPALAEQAVDRAIEAHADYWPLE